MFELLKSRIIYRAIESKENSCPRSRKATSFDQAHSIGILFSGDDEAVYNEVRRLIGNFIHGGKDVFALCYLPLRDVPDYLMKQEKIHILTRKELSFIGFPRGDVVKKFIETEFDILLDLTVTDHLTMDYIAGVSKAGFKAGRWRQPMVSYFDLLVKNTDHLDPLGYLQSVMDYLSIINKS